MTLADVGLFGDTRDLQLLWDLQGGSGSKVMLLLLQMINAEIILCDVISTTQPSEKRILELVVHR